MVDRKEESVRELAGLVYKAIKASPIEPPYEDVTTIVIPGLDYKTAQKLRRSLELHLDTTGGYNVQCEQVFRKTSKGRTIHYDVRVVRPNADR